MPSRRWRLEACVFAASRSDNPRVSPSLGFDIRARIKADGSDYCAINYRPYGLPINRPHPLICPLLRLFSLESRRSEGLHLHPSMGFAPMDNDDPKLSCFSLISPEDYHCQVISRSKSVSLSTFYVRALMQKVQPLKGYSAGRNYVSAMKYSAWLSFNFAVPWRDSSSWPSLEVWLVRPLFGSCAF